MVYSEDEEGPYFIDWLNNKVRRDDYVIYNYAATNYPQVARVLDIIDSQYAERLYKPGKGYYLTGKNLAKVKVLITKTSSDFQGQQSYRPSFPDPNRLTKITLSD